MKLEFEITKFRGKVGKADAAAYVDGKKVTTCEFTFIVDEAAEQENKKEHLLFLFNLKP